MHRTARCSSNTALRRRRSVSALTLSRSQHLGALSSSFLPVALLLVVFLSRVVLLLLLVALGI
jgi:hypothetical protein